MSFHPCCSVSWIGGSAGGGRGEAELKHPMMFLLQAGRDVCIEEDVEGLDGSKTDDLSFPLPQFIYYFPLT